MIVAKRWTFDAAHKLPNHNGKCRNLHGHTYTVEVAVEGALVADEGASDEGMVIDFGDLSAIWTELVMTLDHRFLNDTIPEAWQPTTAENIASYIRARFASSLASVAPDVHVSHVRVWETPTGYAQC